MHHIKEVIMNTMEIILIRHGESKGNKDQIVQGQTDEGLSELGHLQAEKLSEYLATLNVGGIYSSDLGRAEQTAMPTAKKLSLPVKRDPNLREAHFGIWEGLTFNEVKKTYWAEYNAWHEDYFVRPDWFESYETHHLRVKYAIETILKAHNKNDTVLVFTHGGSIKTQIGYFQKMNGKDLANFGSANCSLACLKFNPSTDYEKGKMIYYNKTVINLESNN